ncbi:hypothetical protein L198_05946 [Cryptococcus wingfieldii CBS 7118]|uniref:Calcineurin-like phosphoesterase domain-containing protein n=1 Tax=Cryptococcus wingfieldii CBS 7118 TaxID=1295528 RepID=A0A1E3IS87_9TREE|nr:hypothetical protein L198_05946 [Cryptococcus wingfieldii CBS 7118]ODN91432.1 hypothetical protein L198_05946 [Cryptococcus wingfieldii CBS 7118]
MALSPRLPSPNAFPPTYPPRGRQSGLTARSTQILALRFGWVVLVIWYEAGEFFHSLSTCRFPDSALRQAHPDSPAPSHVVLLADPHVPHPVLSYPEGSYEWVSWIRQNMDILFMKKSWNVVMRLGRVDGVVVVGDMLDWGRGVMDEGEYKSYVDLFRSIFQLPTSTPMHFVPGNHDIPLGPNRLFSPRARARYAKYFEPPNQVVSIANHSLVMLDSVGLVEEDYRHYAAEMQFGEWDSIQGGVIEFVKDLRERKVDRPPGPTILVSHIPLARPERATCGPNRERGRISKGAGPGYQNLLGSKTSKFLLDAINPVVVFSGDDHDYCEHTHAGGVKEVTIKSFSSSAGIRRPGLQLLSLVPPEGPHPPGGNLLPPTYADRPCFLPDQLGVYWRVYLPLAILTACYLFFTNLRSAWKQWDRRGSVPLSDLKARSSPAMLSSENLKPLSSFSTRRNAPNSLNLPSRKSASHLPLSASSALSSSVPRPVRLNSTPNYAFADGSRSVSSSAPVSPFSSPRPSIVTMLDTDEKDLEGGSSTPSSMSRRSSYIYMGGNNSANGSGGVPDSPYLATPSTGGLGLPTASSAGFGATKRVSSSNLSSLNPNASGPISSPTTPRAPLNRLHSFGAPTPKAFNQQPVLYTFASSPQTFVRQWAERAKGFVRWGRKARNGVVGKSWREVVSVAWVVGVVWVVVNALFFLG